MDKDFTWLITALFIFIAFIFGVSMGVRTGETTEKERFQKELVAKGFGRYVINGNKFDFVLNVDRDKKE